MYSWESTNESRTSVTNPISVTVSDIQGGLLRIGVNEVVGAYETR